MNAKSCVEFVLQAMNNVDDEYLNVKIAVDYVGHKEIKRRERVYAYELYHQMRLIQRLLIDFTNPSTSPRFTL